MLMVRARRGKRRCGARGSTFCKAQSDSLKFFCAAGLKVCIERQCISEKGHCRGREHGVLVNSDILRR